MDNLNLFGKQWLNIVFENRNKNYGAYKLRQESGKTTLLALVIGIGFLSLVFGSSYLYASKSGETIVVVDFGEKDPVVPKIVDAKPEDKPKVIEDEKTKPVEKKIEKAMVKDVMENKKLVEMTAGKNATDERLNAQKDFNDNVNSGQQNTKANTDGTFNKDGKQSGDKNTNTDTKSKTDGYSTEGDSGFGKNEIVRLVQKKAAPNEGYEKFFESFARKFTKNPINANVNEVVVKLKFVVEKDGSFTDIQVIDDKHGLGNEAIRVLNSMPKWKPAQHNGITVRSMFTLPIKVKINN